MRAAKARDAMGLQAADHDDEQRRGAGARTRQRPASRSSRTAKAGRIAAGNLLLGLRLQVRRYGQVARWFARDALHRFRLLVLAVLVLSGLAAACQLIGLGVILVYVQALESGAPVAVAGLSLEPRQSLELLLGVAASMLALVAGAVGLGYGSRLVSLQLGRRYEVLCSKRAIALAASLSQTTRLGEWENELPQIVQRYPRCCGRAAKCIVDIVLPILAFAVSFAFLLYADPRLTLWLALLLLLAAPFLYRVNLRTVRHSRRHDEVARPSGGEKLAAVHHYRAAGGPSDGNGELEQLFERGMPKQFIDAYYGRLRAIESSALVTGIVMVVALVTILAYKGSEIVATGAGWSTLAIFLIALRVNLASLSQAGQLLASVNRFYPQVARYYEFLRFAERATRGEPVALEAMDGARATDDTGSRPGDWRLAPPRIGERVSLIVPEAAPPEVAQAAALSLFGLKGDAKAVWPVRWPDEAAASFGESIGLPAGFSSDEIAKRMRRLGLARKAAARVAGLLAHATSKQPIGDVRAEDFAALAMIAAAERDEELVLVDAKLLASLSLPLSGKLLDLLSGRCVVILHRDMPREVGQHEERIAALTDGKGVLLWAECQVFNELRRTLKKALLSPHSGRAGRLEDMFDHDDADEAA